MAPAEGGASAVLERTRSGDGSLPEQDELVRLQDELLHARQELERTRTEREQSFAEMCEANERLVIASVRADELAEHSEAARQRAEALAMQLAASEDQFRTLANTIPMLAWYAHPDGEIAWLNERCYEYTGASFEKLGGWGWQSVLDPADVPRVLEGWRSALGSGKPWEDTYLVRRHDGELRWFLSRAVPLRDAEGRVVRWFGTNVDVDAQKRAEDRARALAMREAAQRERERANAARVELLKRLETAQEEERHRVARDLHDQVGQTLTAISLSLEAVRVQGLLSEAGGPPLAQAQTLLDQLAREIHGVAVRLRPTALDDVGLSAALRQLVTHWGAQTKLHIDLEDGGMVARLHSDVETALYRVVQEALTNMARYAGASRASVVVSMHEGHLTIVVEDDGCGFDPGQVESGRIGILGMRERVAQLGGTLEIESRPGAGTAVIARVPMSR